MPKSSTKPKSKPMTARQYLRATIEVAKLSFHTAPGPIIFKLVGIIITAALPIIVTYFAARTTTELAAAFTGSAGAGRRAIEFIIITAALGLFTTIWNSIDQFIQQIMRYKVESKVSDMMYEHFLSLDFWQYDDKDTADLYDRAQKFSQFFAYVFDRIARLVSQFLTLIIALVALSIFLPWIALFVAIAVIPGLYIQFKLSRGQIAHWNKNVEARRARSYIEWNMLQPRAIADIRLNGLVNHLLKLRHMYREKDEKGRLDHERSFIGKRLASDALVAAVEFGSLVWIAVEIINQRQSIGQFVYVQQLVSRAMGGANEFIRELSTLDEDLANLFDYQKFIELPTRHGGTIQLQHVPEKITLTDVSFNYVGSKKSVLSDINLTIHRGSHIAIVGENGAGKSTLIKLITGLYRPSQGTIMLDDTNLNDIDVASWHAKISNLQQDFQYYMFANFYDNVLLGDVDRPVDETAVKKALEKAEAYDFAVKLPQKMRTLLGNWLEDEDGNKGVDLSGGQWQRLALARGFYRNAPVIILDEPTSAIDALAEGRIFDRLFTESNDKTVITISHRLSTVEKANIIYVLAEGKLVEQGTHDELVQKNGEYCRLFKRQLKL